MKRLAVLAAALLMGSACGSRYPDHSVIVNSDDALVKTAAGTVCGYIEDGIYTFALKSDDGSLLKIDGNMVVDNDHPQSPHEEIAQQALRAGLHRIEVRYYDHNGGMLRLWVSDKEGHRLTPANIYRRLRN